MNNTKKQVVLGALRYVLISAPLLFLGFFLDAGVNSFSAELTGQFFNAILENQTGAARELMAQMVLALVVSVVILPAVVLGTNVIFFHFSLKYETDVINGFFRKNYERMISFDSGCVVQQLLRDTYQLQSVLSILPSKLLAQITVFILTTFLMMRISPVLCAVCVSLGVIGAVFPLLMRKKLAQLDEAKKKFQDQNAGTELEMIQNRSFLNSYGLEGFLAEQQERTFEEYERNTLRKGVWADALAAVLPEGILTLGKVAFLVIGMQIAAEGKSTAGNLVAFFTYLTLMTSLVSQIHQQLRQLAQLPDAVERVEQLVADEEQLDLDVNGTPTMKQKEEWDCLYAKNLHYQYEGTEKTLVYDDFQIRQGECAELRGENGSGKTTLIWMLCGLLQPGQGTLTVEIQPGQRVITAETQSGQGQQRVSLAELDAIMWRKNLSVVEQIPAIFPGTLRENIRIGNPNAAEEQVEAVLKRLGLETQAKREINTAQQLSGGELKKISLGRALLRDANLLILDEPFEHLDAIGQQLVEVMLSDKTKTRIFISHGDKKYLADQVISL